MRYNYSEPVPPRREGVVYLQGCLEGRVDREDGGVRFDGLAQPKGSQYVKECGGGGINLHIYKLGNYEECNNCEHQESCRETAENAGEQDSW